MYVWEEHLHIDRQCRLFTRGLPGIVVSKVTNRGLTLSLVIKATTTGWPLLQLRLLTTTGRPLSERVASTCNNKSSTIEGYDWRCGLHKRKHNIIITHMLTPYNARFG